MSLTKVTYSMVHGAPVNVLDFGAIGDGSTDDTAAIQLALNASYDVYVPVGTYLISSTIIVPESTKLRFAGGFGNTIGAYPPAHFIKKSTMTTLAVSIQSKAWVDGGGLVCQVGNTGEGIALVSNSAKLSNFLVHGAGGVGVRVGLDSGSNANSWQIDHVTSQYNIGDGFYIHDGKAAEGPDANAGTMTQSFSQSNGGHGIHVGHSFFNTFVNCLTELNAGYGLYFSSILNSGTAECRYNTVIGGDFNEGNTLGSAYIGGYSNGIYSPNPNQLMTIAGVRNQVFGLVIDGLAPTGAIVYGATIKSYGIKFTQDGQSALTDPNTLDDYYEGVFTGVATGFSGTAPTGTFQYTKIGNSVTIDMPSIVGTSDAITFTVTGMPTNLIPTVSRFFLVRTVDNGGLVSITVGFVESLSGRIIFANNLTAAGGEWTATGTKKLLEQSISYII